MRARLAPALLALVLAAPGCSDGKGPTAPSGATATTTSDPALAQVVTSDLKNFWAAYDAGGKNGSNPPFQSQYLNAASAGLRDFIASRNVTASSLAQMVIAHPRYFASIRESNLALATDGATVARIRAEFATIKALYPPAVFPPVTLLVGRFSTGGTTSLSGMLIGSEFYSLLPSTPTDELQAFQRDNVQPIEFLPVIVAHEHGHILQGRAGALQLHTPRNLLEQALLEGGADFIGERSSGGNINARLWSYAMPREGALWAEFQAAMHGTDVSRWLYNQGSAPADRPGDLGYFIGYRITEAYYAKMNDKTAALRDLIEVRDADDFLAKSGYAPLPPVAPASRAQSVHGR